MNEPRENLPKAKQTVLGLYVTAKEAYEKWLAEPDKVKIIDIRTPEEYLFVGHPTMAWKIPGRPDLRMGRGEEEVPDEAATRFRLPGQQVAKPDDTLLVMCRAGGRGAMAINMLAQAGFKQVYNIVDGVEGDPVDDPGSVFHGMPMRNGWKNSGCPWTYKPTPERMVLPKADH